MTQINENTNRLAKNTILLYFRMLIIVIVSLFTSRIVLQTLGIADYGVYNVVGGVVAMFSFFTTSLSTAISRYITFAIGTNDKNRLRLTFSTSVAVQLILAVIVCVIAVIVGTWLLHKHMNIPEGRMYAASCVCYCSILTFGVNLISVPYNAIIIAHERMAVFARVSILEVSLKLFVALSLYVSFFDKLITFALLQVSAAVIIRLCYGIYCKRNFQECNGKFLFNKELFHEISGFAGWNLLGSGASLLNTQGINIISNIFFGVFVNAARGVTAQVEGLILQFVNSFTTALNPQITKSYASHNYDYLFKLITKGSKFSIYLMLLFIVPFMFEIEAILRLWLGNFPEYAPMFIRLQVIATMLDFMGNTTARTVWATGNVKKYYLVTCSVSALCFPITILLYYLNFTAEYSYYVLIAMCLILIPLRLYVLHKLMPEFNPSIFYKNVVLILIPVIIISFIPPLIAHIFIPDFCMKSIFVILVGLISTIMSVFLFGMKEEEKKYFCQLLRHIIYKIY